jgi:hypothetical protein
MSLKEKLNKQKAERLNKDLLEKEDFKNYMPLHFPFSNNNGKKNLLNRFEGSTPNLEQDPKHNTTTNFDSIKKDRF